MHEQAQHHAKVLACPPLGGISRLELQPVLESKESGKVANKREVL